ncbi:MAG: UDP-glucose 4-epimerase [Devosia sp.]|nr:UDP-glucose 4-epimerase [Devosia sp.]
MRIIVTGGSGKLGRAVLRDLVDQGHSVLNLDQAMPREAITKTVRIDLTDFGQVAEAILGGIDESRDKVDAVVHLAAIPAPGLTANSRTLKNNVPSTYNVFEACRLAGVKNIVFASSETVLGLPFDNPPPYVPVDEDYFPRPETAYSLGKLLDETMAAQYCRWDPALKIVALRFSNVMDVTDYAKFPGYDSDAKARKWNLWGYIDARDGAQAVRKGLEASFTGFEPFIIASPDTVMSRPNAELLAETFPNVPQKRSFGPNDTLLSIDKARQRLGYAPEHSWRNHV